MAAQRRRIGAWTIAFPALGLAAIAAWIVFGEPSRSTTAGGDRSSGASGSRAANAVDEGPIGGAPGRASRGGQVSPDAGAVGSSGTGLAEAAVSGPVHAGQLDPGGNEPGSDEERRERDRLASGMAKLASDLEWSPGLKEPPQQLVQPQPDPWKRDPSREGPSPTIEAIAPRRARAGGGDRISIRGRNLRVVQVMFGSAPARLLSARGNEVVVEAPPGSPGPVTVAVTNDDGTWAVAPDPFVYGE